MSLEKENKELREKIAIYEGLPAAKFYTALVKGVEHLTTLIETKKLDFDGDPYAKSLFQLAKEADKVMSAMGKGLATFNQDAEEDGKKTKKTNSHKGVGI
jgi:hypothetical protein